MTDRCNWCGDDPLYVAYHDEEWGVPLRDERKLFEFLVLEGAQAGLSWITILRKRENYRRAFDGFDPVRIANYGDADRERLLADPGIVRNRRKIDSAIHNAQVFLGMKASGESFVDLLWSFTAGVPVTHRFRSTGEVPASTPQSDAMSKALRRKGFNFVGTTICYAFMQASGMVNDHVTGCFRHAECRALA